MSVLQSVFSGLNKAQHAGGGNHFTHGTYRLALQRVTCGPSKKLKHKARGGYKYVSEWTIKEVITELPQIERDGVTHPASKKAGEMASQALIIIPGSADYRDAKALGNLNNLLATVSATLPFFLDGAQLEAMATGLVAAAEEFGDGFDEMIWLADRLAQGEGRDFAGLEVYLQGVGIKTQERGGAFTVLTFSPAPEILDTDPSLEEVAEAA